MKHYRSCNLCEAMCGIVVETENQDIVSIRPDKEDPFSQGHICPKAMALKDIHEDSDRLRKPIKRVADKWYEIEWDEAIDEASEAFYLIQKKYGRDAIAVCFGNPIVHNYATMFFAKIFLDSLKTKNRFTAVSLDGLPHLVASYEMFGNQMLVPVPDIDRSDFFLILGANPIVSNGSVMSAPNIGKRFKDLQSRGGKIVVVDPRRTRTAQLADKHLFIRPGTDALLLLALLHVLFEMGCIRLGHLEQHTLGLEDLRKAVQPYEPEKISQLVQISSADIRSLAEEFSKAKSAVAYGRFGISTQEFGGLVCWLINVLNIVTGNFDLAGGAMFTKPAVDMPMLAHLMGESGGFNGITSNVRSLPAFNNELPLSVLAEEIDTEGKNQVRGLISFASNLVLSSPNGQRMERALNQLDYMVSIDLYRNATSSKANLILPPTSLLERDYYGLAFNLSAVRNIAKYAPPVFEAEDSSKQDWEILLALQTGIDLKAGFYRKAFAKIKHGLLKTLRPEGILNIALLIGPYGIFRQGLGLSRLKKFPHGLDFGALEACLPQRLFTHNKKINLAPKLFLADLNRLQKFMMKMPSVNSEKLYLIGRRQLHTNNSWLHNSPSLSRSKNTCTLFIHPDDAAQRNLSDKQNVIIRSKTGEIIAPIELCADMMPGVVSLPHGWGQNRPNVKLSTALEQPGVSINDITDDQFVDSLIGTASFTGIKVDVEQANLEKNEI